MTKFKITTNDENIIDIYISTLGVCNQNVYDLITDTEFKRLEKILKNIKDRFDGYTVDED